MLGLIIICQFILFMMLKLYFFGTIQQAMGNNGAPINNNVQVNQSVSHI